MEKKNQAEWIDFSITEKYLKKYPGVPFGLTLILDCKPLQNSLEFDQYKRTLLRKMRKREILASISQRIGIYDRFFQSFGYPCPLVYHFKRTINSGFPKYNLIIDAHFLAEMCAGILVAVTDYDKIEDGLILDIASEGEISLGMGGRQFTLKEGEIVLRDKNDIICVLCQGADEKTKVKDETKNVLFYSFGVPGIEGTYIKEGLTIAAQTLIKFGGGTLKGLDVFVEIDPNS